MKLSWFNTSMGTHKLYLAYEYVQYKAMQDIKEIELRDSRSMIGENRTQKVYVLKSRVKSACFGFVPIPLV